MPVNPCCVTGRSATCTSRSTEIPCTASLPGVLGTCNKSRRQTTSVLTPQKQDTKQAKSYFYALIVQFTDLACSESAARWTHRDAASRSRSSARRHSSSRVGSHINLFCKATKCLSGRVVLADRLISTTAVAFHWVSVALLFEIESIGKFQH